MKVSVLFSRRTIGTVYVVSKRLESFVVKFARCLIRRRNTVAGKEMNETALRQLLVHLDELKIYNF